MKNEKKIVYEIYINNAQFTCIFLDEKEEKNIPKKIGLTNLEFISKEKKNDIYIKMHYKLNDVITIKIYFDDNERKKPIENNYPLSISLKRLRHLLITQFEDKFCFTYNGNLIQRKEENSFTLKSILQNNSINLITPNFNFIKDENFNQDEDKDLGNNDNGNSQDLINNLNENKINNEENNEIINNKNNEINDKMITKNEKEYEIINNNNDNQICKIKIFPEIQLTELREKLIDLIPKRSKFVKGEEIIEPSKRIQFLLKKYPIKIKFSLNHQKKI